VAGSTVAILGTRYSDLSIEQEVLAPLGVEFATGDGRDADAIVEAAGGADVVICGSGPRFDAATLERLSCRGIVRAGVGVETIDLEAARRLGIWVAHVADYGTDAVAFHALALALAALRRLHEADALVRAGGWGIGDLRPLHLPSALTAGVVGYGRIGRRLASFLRPLGFRLLVHDPLVEPDDAESAPLERLLAESDLITLHVPGLDGDRPLLDVAALAGMRPGSVLVNTARGTLVDAAGLAAGLRAGRPRLACLDVFPGEPPDLSLFAGVEDRLVLSPHMAWYSEESERELRRKAAEEARRLLLGERPRDVVVEPEQVRA
jgi:D-3-phosphoglycerate dehydrogenase